MPHSHGSRRILFSTRLGPNFLWHMLAVARIGYDSEYADRYGGAVPAEDIRLLRTQAGLLRFEGGAGGVLAPFFSTFPGWLHVESKEDLAAYFGALVDTFASGGFGPVQRAFPHVDWSDPIFAPLMAQAKFSDEERRLAPVAARLGEIYLRAYERYAEDVWPEAEEAMRPRMAELSRHFGPQDYVGMWEEALGLCFRASAYEIVLCYANKNGPDYNSLGYNGNLFYYGKPFDRTWQFVSHEVGTHILIDAFLGLAMGEGYDWEKLYGAYEVMAMFFNRRLLRLDSLAYDLAQFNDRELLAFYEERYEVGMSPRELLQGAAERFCRKEGVAG